jgi:hypothetical protein
MKIKRWNKGQMRVIEAILASLIIVAALTFVNFFSVNPSREKYEISELDRLGYNVLHGLDLEGILGRFVYSQEWDNLEAAISVTLPADVYFNLTILNIERVEINDSEIFYGKLDVFRSPEISSIIYPVIGHSIGSNPFIVNADYEPRVLVLQLVRG